MKRTDFVLFVLVIAVALAVALVAIPRLGRMAHEDLGRTTGEVTP